MTTDNIQQIVSYAYPKIQKYYGKGVLDYPPIDTSHKNTYAMHSKEPEATGEHAKTSIAEYDEGTIYLYLPNIPNEEELLKALIHEYTHYKQNVTSLSKKLHAMKYTYETDPHEIEAHKNEEDWNKKDDKGNYLFIKN
jgi:hypothetical protein